MADSGLRSADTGWRWLAPRHGRSLGDMDRGQRMLIILYFGGYVLVGIIGVGVWLGLYGERRPGACIPVCLADKQCVFTLGLLLKRSC